MNFVLSKVGASVTITSVLNSLTGITTASYPTLNLPAGRTFRTVVVISGTPSDAMPPAISSQVDGNLVPAASFTYRFHLPLDSTGTVNTLILIEEQVAGVWYVFDFATDTLNVPQAPAVLASAARPVMGVNAHVFIPKTPPPGYLTPMLNRVAGSNVKLFRGSAPWSYLAPTSAAMDPVALAASDAIATWLRANNAKWVVCLHAIPAAWAAVGGVFGAPPANWADFDAYLDAFLARYGDIIAVVENVNEPNSSSPLIGKNGWDWPTFMLSQQHLYNRAKAYNANLLVAGPGLAFGDSAYLDTMYQQGFGPYMDLVNFHPYGTRFDRGGTTGVSGTGAGLVRDPLIGWNDEVGRQYDILHGIQAMAEVMAAHGDQAKKLLIGEWGVSTSFTGPNKQQSSLDVSLADQSKQIVTAVRQVMRDSRVYAFLLYMLYDNAADANGVQPFDITNWGHGFGLMSPRGDTAKPSLAAYLNAIANPT